MGTPGDTAKIRKVVKSELDSATDTELDRTPSPSTQPPDAAPSTAAEMCRITRLPDFPAFAQPPIASQLEQATIEDYFTQRKFYPTTETIAPHPQLLPSTKTFLSIDQPGPSGLQTPKTKPTATLEKLKRKKPANQLQTPPKKSHQCGNCAKHFTTAEKLNKHQQIHTGTSPFKCDNCKKTFTSKFKLVRHALIHSDRKPFSCTVCERTFHRKDHLKNHIKVHSPSKKVYVCEKANCKKEYTSVLSYRKHQAIHAAEEGNLECQICSDTFQTKEDILYHLKVHAGSRTVKSPHEKKFVCDQCGRRFFTKKDVRRHLVVHTGLREFLCQFCPQRFGRKDHLVRHIKKSHNKKYQEEVVAVKSEPEASTSSASGVKEEADEEVKQEIDLRGEFEGFSGALELSLEEEEELQMFESNLGVLDELESAILEDTAVMAELLSGDSPQRQVLDQEVVLNDPEIQRLMQPTEERNLKLPAFSKTFQPPPPS